MVQGIGTVQYSFITDSGDPLDVLIKNVLFVEDSPMILLCPQQLAQQTGTKGDGFNALSDKGVLTIDGNSITVPYNRRTNLPILGTEGGSANSRRTLVSRKSKLIVWRVRT